MHACTIIARNYLPYARVLAESFVQHNPGLRFTTLVLDDDEGLAEPFDVIGPYDIGIQRDELHRMAMIYDLKELATAVKPWLLRRLLGEGADTVVYFDPDIEVYASIDDIGALALAHSTVLTPHTTVPLPDDDRLPDERMILQAGIYNLGFIAVSSDGNDFLTWWSTRLARQCIVDVEHALFVDQRWVDFVPALFDHIALLDPGCNVAYWNLHGRHLARSNGGYVVDGQPLRFFHFSGFRPDTPHVLSHHMGTRPRILLSSHPEVARLCREYSRRVLGHGYGSIDGSAYTFDRTPGGIRIDRGMRRLFRDELLEAEHEGRSLPPDPFDPSSTSDFVAWLREPVEGARAGVSRYAYALYVERRDLQAAFPDVLGTDAAAYAQWLSQSGQAQIGFPLGTRADSSKWRTRWRMSSAGLTHRAERRLRALAHTHPTLARGRPVWRVLKRAGRSVTTRIPRPTNGVHQVERVMPIEIAAQPAHGVNLVGYLTAELGIGEVARKIMKGLEHASIDFSTITYNKTLSRQAHQFEGRRPQQAPFDTNVICINADQLPVFREDVGDILFSGHRSIGVWFWEVSEFPEAYRSSFEHVDEIWVATSFVRDAITAATAKPVAVIPLPLEMPQPPPISRGELGLPDGFVFLFSFDCLSIVERKNPLGLIHAFRRAFGDGEGPELVLKSINSEHDVPSMERLRLAAAERSDIHLIDGYVSPDEKNALMAECDCYVSLHRSEGFGLTMAEAMAYGKPVIGTGYSGNLDFMNDANSYLIPYALVPIQKGCEPYPAGATWADPDLDIAADVMRRVYEEQEAARALGSRGREDVLGRFSVERTAAFLTDRFEARHALRSDRSVETTNTPATTEEPLAFASSKLALGPGGHFARAKRRRPGLRPLRALLQRLLWPYVLDQHELNVSVVDAAGRLQRDLDEMRQDLSAARVELRERELHDTGTLTELRDAIGSLHEGLGQLESELRERELHDTGTLTELRDAIGSLHQGLGQLESELTAELYVSDPDAVTMTDVEGKRVIGYDGMDAVNKGVYLGFEETFRGSEEFIRERQRVYLDVLENHEPVLDVGCGRGEFLQLLMESGVDARGIDSDPGMVARCREKGLAVEQADAISYLERQPDGSLGVIFSAQVIEHFAYHTLLRFLELAEMKLSPGGLFVAETVNPHSIQAFKAFWVDPTHRAPIFPEVALTMARLHGFASAYVLFPLGEGKLEVDRRNEGEYALVATRAS